MPAVALVVDDSMLIRYTVCRSLKSAALRWSPRPMALEALQILARVHPDLIVTDMQMPKMSGSELITALKKNPDRPRIFPSLLWPAAPAASTKRKARQLRHLQGYRYSVPAG
jgi:CheY-like chemotaxis protein